MALLPPKVPSGTSEPPVESSEATSLTEHTLSRLRVLRRSLHSTQEIDQILDRTLQESLAILSAGSG
jgi:hypothetical protein